MVTKVSIGRKGVAAKGSTARPVTHTVADCALDSGPIELARWPSISPGELATLVDVQAPGGELEHASDFEWRFLMLPVDALENSNEDGEVPAGGWRAAHVRHMQTDQAAVNSGSPEYAGRDVWLRDVWCANTAIYPLFVVLEEGQYRIWDGYRRLAGAFYYGVQEVAVILGVPPAARA